MNIIVDRRELLRPLAKQLIKNHIKRIQVDWSELDQYVCQCRQIFRESGLIVIDFERVNKLINRASGAFKEAVSHSYKQNIKTITQQLEQRSLPPGIEGQLWSLFFADGSPNFARVLAPQLTDTPNWATHRDQVNWSDSFFIRNIVNNEEYLAWCRTQGQEFWFVDSGYTNFLHGKQKLWHRLVHNNIHHVPLNQAYPTDRLNLLPARPEKWRRKGTTILVVEASDSYYRMMGTDLEQWRKNITETLRIYTDRPIEFRAKHSNRKSRQSVYELLQETKEYYCVISHSSAAAIEAIWTGTPVITLGTHVSVPVARTDLSQINDLYRDDIESWLAALTYHQFTYEEFANGTALAISQEYGHV